MRYHFDDILINLDIVSRFDKCAEFHADFALPLGDFVVMHKGFKPHFFKGLHHFSAQIHHTIDRLDGEVAALCARAVSCVVAIDKVFIIIPLAFFAVYFILCAVNVIDNLHAVKDEKLIFGSKVCCVSYAAVF